MDLLFSFLIYFMLFSISLAMILLANSRLKSSSTKLPPGRKGWPVIGESLEFALAARSGNPERFVKDRMDKYSRQVFRTSLIGENMAVFCGAAGNKFLFSNEDKLVTSWWPNFMKKIMYFPTINIDNPSTPNLLKPPTALHEFLQPDAVKRYVEIMDMMARKNMDMYWSSNEEVKVYPISKKYTFELSCRLFLNIKDPESVAKICDGFDCIAEGFFSLPIDIPGTTFNSAIKARNILHREIMEIIKKRKEVIEDKKRSDDQLADHQDLLSHLLLMPDENGKFPSEPEISTYILGLLLASHETTCTVITFVLKYLAELPHVYNAVLKGNFSQPTYFD